MLGAALAAAALAGCPLFPADFTTKQRVDHLPVAAGSDAIVRSIGLDDNVHADFGAGRWEGRPIGIPYTVVSRHTKRSRVRFDYADESDRVRYPIPRGVRIEGGGDRHALRVTVSSSRRDYVWPARHFASDGEDPSLPRMGERLRLKASVDTSSLPRQARRWRGP